MANQFGVWAARDVCNYDLVMVELGVATIWQQFVKGAWRYRNLAFWPQLSGSCYGFGFGFVAHLYLANKAMAIKLITLVWALLRFQLNINYEN